MNTDMTTKFTDKYRWQCTKSQSYNIRDTCHIIKEIRTQSHYIKSAIHGHHISRATLPNLLKKDNDKYHHVVTYCDETITKHPYLTIAVVTLVISQHVTLLITIYKSPIRSGILPMQNYISATFYVITDVLKHNYCLIHIPSTELC